MVRFGLRVWGIVCSVGLALLVARLPSQAVPLDKEGSIKLGVRTYVNARIGTENTHQGALVTDPVTNTDSDQATSATWPKSNAGHLRQNRYFVEAELKHDLDRLLDEGVGPLSLLNDLPFKITSLGYGVTFRGEADGVYDWGPREYSTAQEWDKLAAVDIPNALVSNVAQEVQVPYPRRKRLRSLATHRERLFQAYLDMNVGDLFVRFGRQILSWGETDGFRLLDNINPLDSSFGGFLISLDERRVPLDMLRAQYYLGSLGPFSEVFVEGYASIDNKVGFNPGTPEGSPWTLPSLGAPSNDSRSYRDPPARTISNTRGGGKLAFNAFDATFSLAHYYTYFDTPALQVITSGYKANPDGTDNNRRSLLNAFNDGQPCAKNALAGDYTPDYSNTNCGAPAHVFQTAPKVQVSGLTTTFALPAIYSVVRSELAYFKDEPAFTQGQLDPFLFNMPTTAGIPANRRQTGGKRTRDSINFVIGLDRNQWIRWLNPNQTFFISTQFFYKHIKKAGDKNIFIDADGDGLANELNPNREVLPPYLTVRDYVTGTTRIRNLEPVFITQPADSFLQTFFITSSFMSGQVNPSFVVFYDWGGGLVYQPSITMLRDPFRFTVDYSILDSHIYKGGSGVSLLKDRDNVQFRFEYVI